MTEIWKMIDDRYSVSNFGRIKSNYAQKERVLSPFVDSNGYLKVDIRHGSDRKSWMVHRLVALAFIYNPNPEIFKEVNHKDEDKTNNCVENLEWCDTNYNCNYGTRNQRRSKALRKPICSVDIDGNISHYESRLEAAEKTGISGTSISKALSDKFSHNKSAGGMLWFFDYDGIENDIRERGLRPVFTKKKIYSIDTDGNTEHFESVAEASRQTGITNITRALKNNLTAGGRRWFYDK